jgi:Fe-S-cluster containining protein
VKPKLRPEVQRAPAADGDGGVLVQTVLAYRLTLDGPIWELTGKLDGTREVAQLVAEQAAQFPSEKRIEELLRMFLLMGFLEGSGDAVVERLQALRRGEEKLERMVLDGARFECQGSGECCQNYLLGPLKDSDIARLEKLPIAEHFPELGPGPYFRTREVEGEPPKRYLHTIDNGFGTRCIFLQPDQHCGLHAKLGAEAKPDLCRSYPIEDWITIDGIRTFDKGSCASFARSARRGLTLVDDMPRLRDLSYRTNEVSHPPVRTPLCTYDFGLQLTLQKSLLVLVRRGLGDPVTTLTAIGRSMRGALETLAACPLEEGAPERLVDELCDRAPEAFYLADPNPEEVARGAEHFASLCDGVLNRTMARIAGKRDEGASAFSEPHARELAQLLHIGRSAAGAVAWGSLDDPWLSQVTVLPIFGADCDEVLRISLRQSLFSNRMIIDERPLPAILRMALVMALTVFGGRLHAAGDDLPSVRAEDLSRPHMVAQRTLDIVDAKEVCFEHEEHIWEILEALPTVLAWGER